MIGLYLVPRHANLIYQGEKKGIVKRRHLKAYERNDLELITKIKGVGYALGKIKLSKPKEINLEEFKELYNLHKVTDKERKLWFPRAKKLYFYKILRFEKYEPPRPINIKPGVQTIQHLISEDFVEDISSYNPSLLKRKVLMDDWRIVCFPKDTPVLTPRGLEKIQEVQPTLDMDYLRMERDYFGKIIKIKIDRLGTFRMTPEHPVLVRKLTLHTHSRKKTFSYSAIKKKGLPKETGGWLVIYDEPKWKLAKDLEKDDAVLVPKLPTISTPYSKDLFELIGWYLAEGFPSSSSSITFSLNKNEREYAERIKTIAEKEFNAKVKIQVLEKEIRVKVSSKAFHDFCISNFSFHAKDKTLPLWVLHAEPEKLELLLEAWQKGDGCDIGLYHKGSTASPTLAYGLFLCYLKIGLVPSISYSEGVTNFGKFTKYSLAFVDKPRRTFVEDDNYFYFPIRQVSEEPYAGKVYNLETKNHIYQVPFIVHNCAWYSTKKQGGKLKFSMDQILELAKKIYYELLRRGISPGKTKISREVISKIHKDFSKYLPIHRGGNSPEGEEINLKDFLKRWKSFKIHKDYIYLVGSLPNWGKTTGDIDILIKAEPGTTLWNLTTWRIMRAYPEWKDRFHFIPYSYGNWQGPFTCFVPLGDLEVSVEGPLKVIEMSKEEEKKEKYFFPLSINCARDPEFYRHCDQSLKEDKVQPFRPFYQEKPQHGREVGQPYTIENLIPVVNETWPNWKEVGIYVGIKRDGVTGQVHFSNGKVMMWTEDGSRIDDNLPTLVKQFAKKKGTCVVIGEFEWYHKGKHQPRADTAGILNSKSPLEKEIRFTIYDKLYSDSYKGDFGDIHKKPYSFRREQYLKIHEDENIKVSKVEKLVFNEKDLIEAVKWASKQPGSEGAMLKLASAPYPLTIHPEPPTMIKFKNEYQIIVRVINKTKVKGADAWVYDCAVDEVQYEKSDQFLKVKGTYVGRTYNTSIEANIGDLIKVSFVDISQYIDPKTKQIWFNFWAPHVVGKVEEGKTTPISKLKELVMKTTGRIQEKPLPKRALPAKPETWRGFSSTRRFVLQHHIRGASEHIDFRYEDKDRKALEGFTIAAMEEDALKKDLEKHWKLEKKGKEVKLYWDGKLYYHWRGNQLLEKPSKELEREVFEFHKKIIDNPKFWKINMETGEELKRPGKQAEIVQKIYAIRKAKEPHPWLDVEGITDPRIVEPTPGGTRFYPGIFIKIDEGTLDVGADKPYFKEFFLRGKKWKGRFVFRLIGQLKGSRKLLNWLFWKPDDQSPYVLSERAIEENWLPPAGESALPSDLERKVPPNLVYWDPKLSREERLRRRKLLAEFLKSEKEMSSKFILTRRFWKGQEVIRKSEISDYHLKFGKFQFHLERNPIYGDSAGLRFQKDPEYFTPGKYPPNSKINPNKKIPAYVEILDQGTFKILQEEPKKIQVHFQGKKLKGLYYFLTTDGIFYQVLKQDYPKPEKFSSDISLPFIDFSRSFTSKDIKFPFYFKTVAFSEGTWHGTFYPWEVIKQAAPKILDAPLVTYHIRDDESVLTEVGRVVDYELDEENKRLIIKCELFDTTAGRDCAVLLKNGRLKAVSVRIWEESENGQCLEIKEFPHVAFVRSPEVSDARVCLDEKCRTLASL